TEADRPNKIIEDYVTTDGPKEWPWQPLAKDLYAMAQVFRAYFFRPKEPGEYEMPAPLVAIEEMDVRILGAYHVRENPLGLRWQISLNAKHVGDRPLYSLYETLCHELVHLYQENGPEPPFEKCRNNWHNAQFVGICEEIGLHPVPGAGYHWKPADGQ